jgi:folate-binding protein YgfZ
MSTSSGEHTLATPVAALLLQGRDALAVLHAISTNELLSLGVGESRETLFCDFRGRLLHRALVVREGEDAVRLLTDSPPAALAAFVDAKIFREDARFAPGDAGVPPALRALAARTFGEGERARIEAGLARFGHELAEDFNPYEAGLGGAVHLAKGCYTGQEALQRLITYDSVRRERVRFSGSGAPPAPQEIRTGDDAAGRLTSVALTDNGWIALAIVKLAALDSGAPLTLADGTKLGAAHRFPATPPLGR